MKKLAVLAVVAGLAFGVNNAVVGQGGGNHYGPVVKNSQVSAATAVSDTKIKARESNVGIGNNLILGNAKVKDSTVEAATAGANTKIDAKKANVQIGGNQIEEY
jgi:hypothetical protein